MFFVGVDYLLLDCLCVCLASILFLLTPHLFSLPCHLIFSASLRGSLVWLPCQMVGESSQDLLTGIFECGMWTQESVCESSKAMVM
jgi:hypothetical protein